MADPRRKGIKELIESMRVKPGTKVSLPDGFDTSFKPDNITKEDAPSLLQEGVELLSEYQDRLYAEDTHSVLLVMQAMDAAGKDSTIKHVMSGVNPQGVVVHSFKSPSSEELDHGYLWRCQKRVPARGMIGIFNRSYYEEMLVVRVHPKFLDGQKLPPDSMREPQIWQRRFREVNDWERYLHDQGTRVVKVFLNVGKDEQARRFLARIEDPSKNWKFSAGDLVERGFWNDYQHAYSEVLTNTSTDVAPWYVVPADRKWFARLATAAILVDTIMGIDPQYPTIAEADAEKMDQMAAQLRAELPPEE